MIHPDIDKALKELIVQWNIAERRIKRAEQVRAEQIVSSAIFELRYAGRKIVDAIDMCLTHDVVNDEAARNKVLEFIADATEDCVKAKHDAIDAMLSFVTVWFDNVEKSLSLTQIQQFFPNYLQITSRIAGIQEKIADSRENRTTRRDSNYDEIEQNGYGEILELYKTMKTSKERVDAVARKERFEKIALWVVTILALAVPIAIEVAKLLH